MTAFQPTYMPPGAAKAVAPSDTASALPEETSRQKFQIIGVPLFMLGLIAATCLTSSPVIAFACVPVFFWGVSSGALRDRAAGLMWFMAYISMEGMFKYLSNFSPMIYIISPLLALLMVAKEQIRLKQMNQRWKTPPMFRLILCFTLWGVAITAHPLGQGIIQAVIALLIWYVAPLLMYMLVYNRPLSSQELIRLLLAFCSMYTVVAIFAVVQYVMGKEWTFAHLPGYSNMPDTVWFVIDKVHHVTTSSWRPASTGSQGGGGSFWMFMGLITGIGLLLLPALDRKIKIALVLSLPIHMAGLVVSGVRLYVVLGILQSLVLVLLNARTPQQMRRAIGIIASLLVGIGLAFTFAQIISGGIFSARYGATLSNPVEKFQQDRGNNVSYLPTFIAAHPLGIGFQRGLSGGKSREDIQEKVDSNRETEFNAVTDDLGVPGLLMQTALLIGCVFNGWRSYRRIQDPALKTLSSILFVTLFSYLSFCMGGPALLSGYHFWAIAALAAMLPGVELAERASTARNTSLPPTKKSSFTNGPRES